MMGWCCQVGWGVQKKVGAECERKKRQAHAQCLSFWVGVAYLSLCGCGLFGLFGLLGGSIDGSL